MIRVGIKNKKSAVYWASIVVAIVGMLLVFLFSGCAVIRTGGYWESPPLNRIEAHAKIEPPAVLQNLYNITHKETGPDRAGKGFIRYDIINKRQCILGRKIQIDVPKHEQKILTCDFGSIFADYYIPIEQPTRIALRLLGSDDKVLEGRVVTITPDIKMIGDYSQGGVQYGWRIIVKLSHQGILQISVSDPHQIDPRR